MTRAIRIHQTGGPEVLEVEEIAEPEPDNGEVLLRHTAIGLNYIDVYFRTGLYKGPELPFTPGMEGAGIIEAVGAGVTDLRPGDRVAYASAPLGSYAEHRVFPADRLVPLPDQIDDQTAAAVMLKGMTAHYLLRKTRPIEAGDTILFHAAAGGVGLLACQWASALGATVIGTVGTPEKAELARRHGCTYPIVHGEEDFVERVREITDGRGVPVVYDSVGRDTFMRSLDCLAPRGHLVSFGQSSGPVEPLDVGILAAKGSLTLTRPTLAHYVGTQSELRAAAQELFGIIADGNVQVRVGTTFPLREAARAHQALEARETTGSTLLLPDA